MRARRRGSRWSLAGLSLALLASTPPAWAGEAVRAEERSMFRGSHLSYRNTLTLNTFDRSAELTYNPGYLMGLELGPRVWFGEHLSLRARLDMQIELTTADDTTYQRELMLGDLAVVAGLSRIATIPWLEVAVGVDLAPV